MLKALAIALAIGVLASPAAFAQRPSQAEKTEKGDKAGKGDRDRDRGERRRGGPSIFFGSRERERSRYRGRCIRIEGDLYCWRGGRYHRAD